MAQHDILGRNAEKDMGVRVRNLSTATPLASTSVTNGHTEFNGNESLLVKGSQKVSGWLIITGTLKVVGAFLLDGITTITGALTSSGTALFTGAFTSKGTTRFEGDTTQVGPFHITGDTDATGAFATKGVTRLEGDTTQVGPLHVQGNQDNTGTLTVKGATRLEALVTLLNDLTVVTGGRLKAGNTIITSSGVVGSTTSLLLSSATGTTVLGDFAVTGAKSFRIPHPVHEGYSLTHGSTESPVSGTEYWGTGVLDAVGEAKVSLPEYFESLNKATGRAVVVCPIGRPFAAGADEINAGEFTVYGEPEREFTWLVKAERIGADFVTEAPAIAAEEAVPDLGLADEL